MLSLLFLEICHNIVVVMIRKKTKYKLIKDLPKFSITIGSDIGKSYIIFITLHLKTKTL